MNKGIHYLNRNRDELAILTVLADMAFRGVRDFSEEQMAVIHALRRSSEFMEHATLDQIASQLSFMDDSAISGLVSNVKGILHEMEFMRIENEDGDSIHVAMFPETNHADMDIVITDSFTGLSWESQLKASDSTSYVQAWIDDHPGGEILVTEEVANSMGLPSTGISNEELTARVEDVVDELLKSTDDSPLWHSIPELGLVSIAPICWELGNRYKRGELTKQQLQHKLALASGLRLGKVSVLIYLLSLPGINVAVGAGLVAKLIYTAKDQLGALGEKWRPFSAMNSRPSQQAT